MNRWSRKDKSVPLRMGKITKEFLIEQGFVKVLGGIALWEYHGIRGRFTEIIDDGEGIFYFFDFSHAVIYQDDIVFLKKLIDYTNDK